MRLSCAGKAKLGSMKGEEVAVVDQVFPRTC